MVESNGDGRGARREKPKVVSRSAPPEVYAIVVECQDEGQQREMFERLKAEGLRVRVLVL